MYALPIRFERFEGQYAVFSTQLSLEVRLPGQIVPADVETGSALTLELSRGNGEEEKLRTMRRLLEELIN